MPSACPLPVRQILVYNYSEASCYEVVFQGFRNTVHLTCIIRRSAQQYAHLHSHDCVYTKPYDVLVMQFNRQVLEDSCVGKTSRQYFSNPTKLPYVPSGNVLASNIDAAPKGKADLLAQAFRCDATRLNCQDHETGKKTPSTLFLRAFLILQDRAL